jgi:hypothetical protein
VPVPPRSLIRELVLAGLFLPSKHGGGVGRGRPTSRTPSGSGAWLPDGGHGAVRDVDRGTPLAECQWWVLGHEWEWAGAPKVFSSHGSGYGNWEGFSPRVRTARLQGGVAQLSPEEDFRTSVEGGLPCRHMATVAAVTANRRNPGGGGVGRGAGFSPPSPANAAATSNLSVLWRRRRRRRSRRLRLRRRVPLGPRPRVQWEMPLGRRPPPGGWTVAVAITRSGWSIWAIWGCPPWRHS